MKEQDKTQKNQVARRDFLRVLGAGAGVAATAAARSPTWPRPTPRTTMKSGRPATRKPIIVKAFYRVNRYPG